MTDGSGFRDGDAPSSTTNSVSGSSTVGAQAGTVHGDVRVYMVPPGATPEERFEVGALHLEGNMPPRALELMNEAVLRPTRTDRMLFHWLLALVSGRSRDELTTEQTRQLKEFQAGPPAAVHDAWTDGLRVVLLLLNAVTATEDEMALALKELDALDRSVLGRTQRRMILRHLEQFLEGPLEDQMWRRAIDVAARGQQAGARQDRVWKFFEPPPIEARARGARPTTVPADTRLRAEISRLALVAWAVYLAIQLTLNGRLEVLFGCAVVLVGGLLGLQRGIVWNVTYDHTQDGSEIPPGAFARKVEGRLRYYVASYRPHGLTSDQWLWQTADARFSLLREIVGQYSYSRISIERIAWLLRHEATHLKRLSGGEARVSFRRELRVAPGVSVRGTLGITAVVGGCLWATVAAAGVDLLLAVGTVLVVSAGTTGYARAWLAMNGDHRRRAAETAQHAEVLAARQAAFERRRARLADRPSDAELAQWLDHDRKLLLDRALRHYRLTASDVVAHAFIETPVGGPPNSEKGKTAARVPRGPWRFRKYQISVFLLTADGVRNLVSRLNFETGVFTEQNRMNYRFDVVASIRVDRTASDEQKLELVLVDGTKIGMQMAEVSLDEDTTHGVDESTESVARLTQDAAGVQHTIHVLEGIAAEGRAWVRRTGFGRSQDGGRIASALRDENASREEESPGRTGTATDADLAAARGAEVNLSSGQDRPEARPAQPDPSPDSPQPGADPKTT
ncbi:hypothetical protein MXD62_03610 [Frankia sp. Mgl5]|uniref:hypothetical protein n=1 Tax=Frankia sp. Mgl5 TaxID=2933793 RepID=UPI00200DC910|nr:hypothetical protein [Frankia sp. Mgl5]MCK9926262.1 hypothetical protein [Frankia sp. Mgl5]